MDVTARRVTCCRDPSRSKTCSHCFPRAGCPCLAWLTVGPEYKAQSPLSGVHRGLHHGGTETEPGPRDGVLGAVRPAAVPRWAAGGVGMRSAQIERVDHMERETNDPRRQS